MPRPKTKEELISLSHLNFEKLMNFINQLPGDKQEEEFPKGTLNRNIRDVLTHLHHWHLMLNEWYDVGATGDKPAMPAKGYTWKTLPALNKMIWQDYQHIGLPEAKEMLKRSFLAIQTLIEKHTEEELFEKKKYHWTGSTSLGAYLISATASHYDWALKLIKKAKK